MLLLVVVRQRGDRGRGGDRDDMVERHERKRGQPVAPRSAYGIADRVTK